MYILVERKPGDLIQQVSICDANHKCAFLEDSRTYGYHRFNEDITRTESSGNQVTAGGLLIMGTGAFFAAPVMLPVGALLTLVGVNSKRANRTRMIYEKALSNHCSHDRVVDMDQKEMLTIAGMSIGRYVQNLRLSGQGIVDMVFLGDLPDQGRVSKFMLDRIESEGKVRSPSAGIAQ